MVISEIIKRGHHISVFDENNVPTHKKLLECDVLIDMSAITKKIFYTSLKREYEQKRSSGHKVPLMVDSPEAILNSLDKRKTHKNFPNLVPESYNLNGKNNKVKINKFKNDEFVVIKTPLGWWGENIVRVTPRQAIKKYEKAKGLIVQKYIPSDSGIGRIVTLNYKKDFEIICSYIRISSFWRTGVDVDYECKQQSVTKELHDFALFVSKQCGLYLNGIDYIYHDGKYVLLEVNAIPAMKEPYDEFKIDVPKKLLDHIKRCIKTKK